MDPRPFRLEAFTRMERHAALEAAEAAIGTAGAWITDFHQFSNAAVVLRLDLPPDAVGPLYQRLEAIGLNLRPGSPELLAAGDAEAEAELSGTLRITFLHDEPDLRVVVPAVPG